MRDDDFHDADALEPTGLEQKLRRLGVGPVPEDLLERCLGTIPAEGPAPAARPKRRVRWIARVGAVAAVLLIGAIGLMARPRHADAAHLLQAVRDAWTEVPVSHCVVVLRSVDGSRHTTETWFVRGKGRREEVRAGDTLIGILIQNARWEFRWDVPGKLVAAWSTAFAGRLPTPKDEGRVVASEDLVRWAESHNAEIRIEPDSIDGLKVRKIVLRWPGPKGDGPPGQTDTFWFDPGSLRPLRQRIEASQGIVIETTIDYPDPGAVSNDLFTFRPPKDVVLEINDPDLGRQVYSDGQAGAVSSLPDARKGAKR